jgi:hypothetical protein
MSNAAELMRRAADALRSELGPVPPYYIYGLIQELEEHFLADEPEAEPIGFGLTKQGVELFRYLYDEDCIEIKVDLPRYPSGSRFYPSRLEPEAEPEVEYDLSQVINLTHRKAKSVIKDCGYNVTGFVLTREDRGKCIVDMSAVRWFEQREFIEMMHPVETSPSAEKEAEPVAWIIETELQDGSYSRWACMDRKRHEEHHDSLSPIIPLYTRPEPARKPMTEEEISKLFPGMPTEYESGFRDGIDFAEKHHGIDGNPSEIINNQEVDKSRKPMTEKEIMAIIRTDDEFDEMMWDKAAIRFVRAIEKHHGIGANLSDPDSIDLQSRCRGDKL